MSARCSVCAKPLPEGAKKCIKCGDYQSLLRQIMSAINFQSLVALVPIVTLAFAFIKGRIETKQSDMQFSLVACEQSAVTLFASNVGNRAAVIGKATYRVGEMEPRKLLHSLEPSARLLEGGQTRNFELRVDKSISPGGLVPFNARQKKDCTVSIQIRTTTFDHRSDPKILKCDCP